MHLRHNRTLKLFVLILFLLEFLSPVMLASAQKNNSDPFQTHFSTLESSNVLLALLQEDLTETEENKEDQKEQFALIDFLKPSFWSVECNDHSLRQRFLISTRFTEAPERFLMFCTYRI